MLFIDYLILYFIFIILLSQINYIMKSVLVFSNISHYAAIAFGTIALSCASPTYVWICFVIVIDALASSIRVCHFRWAFYACSIICFEGTLLTYAYSLKLIIRHIHRTWNTFIINHNCSIHAFACKFFGIENWIYSAFNARI